MKKLTCRLCGSTKLKSIVPMNPLPLVDSYSKEPNNEPLHLCGLDLCEKCDHIQLCEVVDPKLLFRDGYLFRTADYPWLVEHFREYAESVYGAFHPQTVLEIGSNDGTLAKFFEDRGCAVMGVDPCDVPSSVNKLKAFFTEDLPIERKVDLILANHVFAHVDDLDGIVRGVKKFLAPNGVFVFEADYGMDILEKNLFDRVYHEHLDYHTVTPLRGFFAKHDLVLFRIEHNQCKGGAIRGFVAHAGRAVERSVRLWSMYELRDMQTQLEQFAKRIMLRAERARDAIDGRKLVGFGASAGPIATMYHLALEKNIYLIVDDSPRRHNLYAPHSNQLVTKPELIDDAPVVMLATRYAEQIQAKHPTVEFIIP